MEELQVIETTSGRQFKPWATKDDVQDPSSVTALASEIASGKQAIAAAINAKGGEASATESFNELAEAVAEIPNLDYMARLAGIIAGGNYSKNALQGHNENVKYGKTEIIDNAGAFETINVPYCFQNWDLLERVDLPNLTTITNNVFSCCSLLQEVNLPMLSTMGGAAFSDCSSLQVADMPNLTTIRNNRHFQNASSLKYVSFPALNISLGNDNFMFNNCSNLEYVLLPSITGIGNHTFDYVGGKLISMVFGTLVEYGIYNSWAAMPNLHNITVGQDTNINLPFQQWTATNVIAEGQSGIDELNANLQTNLISKLYQGGEKILRLGTTLYDVTTQETRDMVTAKGWTLQRG